jgi:hypothetical protein
MEARTEIADRNGYDRFLSMLDPSAFYHVEVVYPDRSREFVLGRFLSYECASDFVTERAWLRKDNEKYRMVDPERIMVYAVVDWTPRDEAKEVPVPEIVEPRQFILRPAFGRSI